MRITIFGLTLSSSWGNGHATPYRALIRALHQLGHEVTFYEKDVPYYAERRDFEKCDYCDLVLYRSWNMLHAFALIAAASSDVVINASYCPDGAKIAETMLRVDGPLHVYYDLDAPVTLAKFERGEEVEYMKREFLPYYDLVLSWSGGRILDELETKYGAQMARPLYGSVDPDVYQRVSARNDLACDLSYMGTFAADRQHKLDELFLQPACEMSDRRFALAGSMYPWEMQFPPNVHRIEHLAPADHSAFYSSSAFTLNITRGEMAEWGYCPSGRFFEAAACGTPIITDSWEGLDLFFEVEGAKRELLVVRNSDDVKQALAMDTHEREAMARRARARTLDEHTGMARAQQLVKYLEEAATRDLERMEKGAAR